MAESADGDARTPKLADVWGFVLLRGLVEGALIVLFFVPFLQEVGPLALFITAVLCGGSLIELVMAYRLPGHAFRSILIFIGVTGLMIGGFIFFFYGFAEGRVTLALLVTMMALWVSLRGFAALWLGLSIVSGTFERAVPTVAGLVGLGVGTVALLFFTPESSQPLVRLLSLYGLGSVIVHLLVALRMRRDRRRHLRGASARHQA